MKFTHGIWEERRDTIIYSATEVAAVSQPRPGTLRALCATRHVAHRGDTLNRPTITLSVTAAAPDIVSCVATHFKGSQKASEPRFELGPGATNNYEKNKATVTLDGPSNTASLENGGLYAILNKESSSFSVDFVSRKTGKTLTAVGYQGLQYIVAPPNQALPLPLEASTKIGDPYYRPGAALDSKPYMKVSFDLQVGELVYGLGERFGPLAKNGQEIDLWNEDAGTCTLYTYKNVPFYWTNRGYGIFFDHTDVLSFEVQTERLAKVQVSLQGEEIRWYMIHGPTPKEIFRKYASLTGYPALPPAWSFGLYLSTSFITDYNEATVTEQVDGMISQNIPLSVLHFDCFWMREYTWTSFQFDPRHFPDTQKFLDNLHKRGLKVCVWINPYIAQESDVFDEAMEQGYLVKRLDGTVWQSDNWQAGMGIVDFTNPGAVEWYQGHLTRLLDLGVDTFKTDFGERIPWENVQFFNGMDPRQGHNYYSLLYNRAAMDAIRSQRGNQEAAVFARAATAGGQTMPVHWGGDCESTWPGMQQSLRGGLSLGLSGFGFWSHDIGGFIAQGLSNDIPKPNIYKRWVQFGLLSSHSRLHGSHTYRVPWLVDEEAVEVLSKFSQLKNRLMPYLFAQAIDCHRNGLPMLRAMLVEFPEDRTCAVLDEQYMLGDSLLVAPIFNDDGVVEYYVPEGTWVGLLDGKSRIGPGWKKEIFDNLRLPVLVRQNRAILLGTSERPDYDWPTNLTQVVVGSVGEGETIKVPVPSSTNFGEFEGHVLVSKDSDPSLKVETSAEVTVMPSLLVLQSNSHL